MLSVETMLLYLCGSDTFRSRQQLKKMITKFKTDRDPQGFNVVRLDVEKSKENVLQQILAAPFLAERRMVVLENLLVSKEKDLQTEILQRIKNKNFPESNVIIFWEGTDKFKTKLGKELHTVLSKEKFAQSFGELTGGQLQKWIRDEVGARGGKIESAAVSYLAQHVGGDMWRLASLVDQLVAYKSSSYKGGVVFVPSSPRGDSAEPGRGERVESKEDHQKKQSNVQPRERPPLTPPYRGGSIELSDVQLFLDEKADDNIFNLVDAIVNGQKREVFSMMEEQYRQGKDAGYIFAMILRQFKILLQIRDLSDREDGLRSDVMAKKLGLHPFVVKKSLPMIKRYNMVGLKGIYDQLLDIDVKTKTGQGDQSMLVDLFVGSVVT